MEVYQWAQPYVMYSGFQGGVPWVTSQNQTLSSVRSLSVNSNCVAPYTAVIVSPWDSRYFELRVLSHPDQLVVQHQSSGDI